MAKKPVPTPPVEPEIMPGLSIPPSRVVEKELATFRGDAAKALAMQPKRRVRIPLPAGPRKPGEKPRSLVVGINGYNYQIRLGDYVDVPESVAQVLEQGNYI